MPARVSRGSRGTQRGGRPQSLGHYAPAAFGAGTTAPRADGIPCAVEEVRRSSTMQPREPRPEAESGERIPLGQRLFDSPILLLIACILIMFVFYTGWGMLEIASLTPAPLP